MENKAWEREAAAWFDEEGLLGACKYPSKWSNGNALLDTALFLAIAPSYSPLHKSIEAGYAACEFEPGIMNKNKGRPDKISHDEMIGAACSDPARAQRILTRLIDNFGVLSNTGRIYYDAIVKPWHYAFYYMAPLRNQHPPLWAIVTFGLFLRWDALFKGDPSGKKLIWLMINTTLPQASRLSPFLFWSMQKWLNSFEKKWGDEKGGALYNVFKSYYSENHILTQLANMDIRGYY